jgi:hypothetical protein
VGGGVSDREGASTAAGGRVRRFGIKQYGAQWGLTYRPDAWASPLPFGGKFAVRCDSPEAAQAEADRLEASTAPEGAA